MLNASPLLKQFLKDIDITAPQNKKLNDAKQIVRSTLRTAFSAAGREISNKSGKTVNLRPRFRTQGSMAYKTANQPAYTPLQQIDVDDGAYLPMSFMEDMSPSVASDSFFTFVDKVLEDLANSKGWTFDRSKDTCVRLIIDEESHIDIPLYAIPDEEFQLLESRMKIANMSQITAFSANEDMYLDPDQVQLAHRVEGWKASDPRKIQKWFLTKVKHHGEQLRQVCRLMKAWRDAHPDLDGLSSILLMAAVTEVYDGRVGMPKRSDLALLAIADELPSILPGVISNPADPSEKFSDRVSITIRERAAQKLWDFRQDFGGALDGHNQEATLNRLRDHFGERMPLRPDLIPLESARAEVKKHPATIVPAAAVISSKSG